MKILVIGSGGREHAMVWKLRQSPLVEKLWCAPGNDGMVREADCMPLDVKDVKAAADLAKKLSADFTIVGPEAPLVLGIGDEFRARGLRLLGPGAIAAQLEGSKIFAKRFLERHSIPTARVYGIYEDAHAARASLKSVNWPLVIKADGLCAGKGVLVTSSAAEAADFIARVMEKEEFGDAGKRVLLEEGLGGEELSYILLTDGDDFIRMAPARDYKRAFDNDQGPNTGGMGVYSTDEILPNELEKEIIETVVRPTLDGLKHEHMPYRGFLYFGLMLTSDGPKVLEYNCRLGDPETEATLPRADFDFAEACVRAADGGVRNFKTKWSAGASVCVVIASKGYPGDPETGMRIDGLKEAEQVPGVVVFHAGTRQSGGVFQTTGGRVLMISALGGDITGARQAAYDAVSRIKIEGSHFRSDIGVKGWRMKEAAKGKVADMRKG
ncbi:MAG TPA: phosphoribosylamine--glycine ligase [Candidatus Acidoferrum sp.]|nr:phosphoribosylamine--glycine ligase [Candidatus Acidoferrum sp.]